MGPELGIAQRSSDDRLLTRGHIGNTDGKETPDGDRCGEERVENSDYEDGGTNEYQSESDTRPQCLSGNGHQTNK